MGKEIRLFKSQERKNREEVAAFLTQLADKISSGQVVLRKGKEEINLKMPYNLVLKSRSRMKTRSKRAPSTAWSWRSSGLMMIKD